ncbi:DUF3040 domain-containing protein [Paractinoplanes durhamensis]|uniref:DUF3040 domain-containing protein n=1 Tax=Paractinoplanes durhamensis TaxID=113563 RepID=A0ABQ3Z1R5_9ACTN|nr:DUF3040 domain-containing protein [Actinoplanes durhamensis]GIE03777.1 hypothetical protein Adu01nite_51270 [Actinoplanes durhamensis]
MLDGDHRRALEEIERHLHAEDPALAARLSTLDPRPFPTILVLSAALYITLPLVALMFGATVAIVTLGLGVALMGGILIRRRAAEQVLARP